MKKIEITIDDLGEIETRVNNDYHPRTDQGRNYWFRLNEDEEAEFEEFYANSFDPYRTNIIRKALKMYMAMKNIQYEVDHEEALRNERRDF